MPQLNKVVTTLATVVGNPRQLCFDPTGRYLWYTSSVVGRISQYDTQTSTTTAVWFGTGTAGGVNGANGTGQVSTPASPVTDGTYVYWTESANNKIRRADIAGVNARAINDFIGSGTAGTADGVGTAATVIPAAMTINTAKTKLYVTQGTTLRVVDIASATISTITGLVLRGSQSLAIDTTDTYLYTSNVGYILRIPLVGGAFQTRIASNGATTADADGLGRSSQFRDAEQFACDADFLYIAENVGNTVRQLVLSPQQAVPDMQTVMGTGTAGSVDGTGTAATIANARGVAVWPGQAVPTLVVSDYNSNKLRKIV